MMIQPSYKILEHPSDVGIEAYGNSIEEIFCNATLALMFIIAGSSKIEAGQEREIKINAIDKENLLVRWLSEILFLFDAEKFLTSKTEFLSIANTGLKAKIYGEKYDSSKHHLKLDVKAVTYHQLGIKEHNGVWTAKVFLDV